jgi:hypothetical protein
VFTSTTRAFGEALRPPGLLDEIRRNGQSAEWRVLLAVTYVQTSVIAPASESRDRLLRLFEEPSLAEYATRGRALSEEVVAAQNENPLEVELRLRRCLDPHLALAETDATVRYLFQPRTP